MGVHERSLAEKVISFRGPFSHFLGKVEARKTNAPRPSARTGLKVAPKKEKSERAEGAGEYSLYICQLTLQIESLKEENQKSIESLKKRNTESHSHSKSSDSHHSRQSKISDSEVPQDKLQSKSGMRLMSCLLCRLVG